MRPSCGPARRECIPLRRPRARADPPAPPCREAARWHTLLTPSRASPQRPRRPPHHRPLPHPPRPRAPAVRARRGAAPARSRASRLRRGPDGRQYAQTWAQLSPQFKQTHFCCESDGSFQFGRYRAWWEQVAQVEVLDARVQAREPQEVVVQATVRYVMRTGA